MKKVFSPPVQSVIGTERKALRKQSLLQEEIDYLDQKCDWLYKEYERSLRDEEIAKNKLHAEENLYDALVVQHNELVDDYDELRDEFDELQDKYDALQDKYDALVTPEERAVGLRPPR